jgi:uncharacterized lipoprotein YajG
MTLFGAETMKRLSLMMAIALLSGCQYLPMQTKEAPSGYFAHHHSKAESNGHEFRGYDFPPRHYF